MRQISLFPEKEHSNRDSIIKIFMADPYAMIREGPKRILENLPDMTVVG